MQLTSADIDAVCELVEDLCGIALDGSKSYLIESRLAHIVKREGLESYADLVRRAQVPGANSLVADVIDAITTNETLFFRDRSPFEALRHKVVPEIIDARSTGGRSPRIRIWSAACSTGQEPYSIAIALSQLIPDIEKWNISILGTDISDACIAKARLGVFAEHEITRGLTPEFKSAHFKPCEGGWKINDNIRQLGSFQNRNLLDPFAALGKFDVIFCRNVAIYFSHHKRTDLFLRLTNSLATDGALFVGSSESLADIGPQFTPLHHCRSVYYEPNRISCFA
jgi:chemotaxis protein methyltransferase CheR